MANLTYGYNYPAGLPRQFYFKNIYESLFFADFEDGWYSITRINGNPDIKGTWSSSSVKDALNKKQWTIVGGPEE